MVEIITGAIIALVSVSIGYYAGYTISIKLNSKDNSEIEKLYRTDKGLLNYKKYVPSK